MFKKIEYILFLVKQSEINKKLDAYVLKFKFHNGKKFNFNVLLI